MKSGVKTVPLLLAGVREVPIVVPSSLRIRQVHSRPELPAGSLQDDEAFSDISEEP
jgi:hypothetical protein